MKIFTMVGTRPQFIKASVLSKEIEKTINTEQPISEILIHTGQHYDQNMSDKFFKELGIPEPKYNLGVGGGTHGENTGRMIELIEKILIAEKPDFLLVYGDTDSTLAGSIAASKIGVPILHVESGLRSYIRTQPEEINRLITDHLSHTCFAPTKLAVDNLLKEGIEEKRIFLSGDIMVDCVRVFGSGDINKCSTFINNKLSPKEYILTTIHRAENTNNVAVLTSILLALNKISTKIVLPIHPRTRKIIKENNLMHLVKNLVCIEPQSYKNMAILSKNALVIITDSGGLQKEAYLYSVPCLTLRERTEWQELVDSGWNKLCNPSDGEDIIRALEIQKSFSLNSNHPNFYGEGYSSKEIVSFLQKLRENI